MTQEKSRLQWLDVAKGYGILLVIMGHFSAPVLQVPLYSFHMPLFFFLSGYVFSIKSGLREFVSGKMMRIVLPYFCLGVPLVLSHVFFSKDLSFCPSDIGHELLKLLLQRRYMTIWFLATLLMLNVFSYPIARFFPDRRVGFGISVLVGAAGLLLWRKGIYVSYWNVDIALVALPFFYAGYCLKGRIAMERLVDRFGRRLLAVGVLLLLVAVAALAALDEQLTGQMVDLYHSNFTIEGLTHLTASIGIVMVVLLSGLWMPAAVRYIGHYSMIFFAWHQFMVIPLLKWASIKVGLFGSEEEMTGFCVQVAFYLLTLIVLTLVNEVLIRTKFRFLVDSGWKKPRLPV